MMEPFSRHEKMLQLREDLLAVEEERAAGRAGCTVDALDSFLDDVISRVEDEKPPDVCAEMVSDSLPGEG